MNDNVPGSRYFLAAAAVTVAVLARPGLEAASNPRSQGKDVQVRLLSSPAQRVSGGDARIEVCSAPGLQDKLQFYVNSQRVNVDLQRTGSHAVQDVVSGFSNGENTLEV